MIRTALIPALLLAACSAGEPAADNAAPAVVPTPVASPTTVTAAPPADVTPRPGALKTFGDWTVGCDNGGRCSMASLLPEGEFGDGPTMTLTRDPGPAGRYSVEAGDDGNAPRFAVDGRAVVGDADALAAAIANGTALKLAGQAGTVSLKGANAALRYIDAQQGRVGTVTATIAKGTAPAATVPAAPMLPSVAAQRLEPSQAKLPATVTAEMNRIGQCEMGDGVDATPTIAKAPDGKLLVVLPCSAGAYNVIGALFVVDGTKVTPAQTDAPAGFDETGADSQTPVHSVVNGDFDGNVLTSYAKGRGLGDCGVSQRFAWDGNRYRLVEQSEMGECRGNTATITTWRAATTGG
ncbi:hypothetical protein GGQ80_000321 [Sphingomonas jinjuensis]|uniref:DUF1176 domain-containing protein n=1 Tax=Sphingomonas jinjuensis TaxID=535907 RepID=A0A840FGH6_9SPHN|nr:DUF1176 domain-containing protein [Sphingomonas jinjuensis]MBB4152445.1 hypothetical protein [Sphingomonas jinjuensis]